VKKNGLTLAALTADPANRRAHGERNLALIADALREVGAARSIVVDEANVILAGNGVVQAAQTVGLKKLRIVEAAGDEVIAVRRTGLTEAQKRALALFDNRTSELAEWNIEQLLADQQAGLDLAPFWTDEELAALLNGNGTPKAGLTDPDAVPEVRATDIQRGDLFELGGHRLLCGDSTVAADVARVMGEDRAGLMNTDPPYGVDYAAVKNGIPRSGFRDIQARGGDITNDDLTDGPALQAFLEAMIRAAVTHLTDAPAFYLWHPMLTQGTFFAAAAAAADILIHRQIIWVKPHMVLTRSGQYHWKHELCFYGWIRGHPCPWYGEKNQVSVWPISSNGSGDGEREHPTQKPVALFIPALLNHTRRNEWVYEPFAGSGSQLIASEQQERRCAALEIEPQYCQVTLDRWEQFTGERAKKVGEAVRDRPVTRSKVTRARKTKAETEPPARRGRRAARARQ
jgi:DNA modification methylase